MKDETKYLIAWIKGVIANCPYIAMPDSIRADSDEKKEDAIKFLNSLPEIETKLCQGGYIQDRNGKPCCNGDKVRFEFEEKGYNENWSTRFEQITEGKLSFCVETHSFQIIFGCGDWIDWTIDEYGPKWFEKVEKRF